MVHPITDTFAEVWDKDRSSALNELDKIQTDLARMIIGARKNTPKLSINAEIGWLNPKNRRQKKTVTLFAKTKNLRRDHCLRIRREKFDEYIESDASKLKTFPYKLKNKFSFFKKGNEKFSELEFDEKSSFEEVHKTVKQKLFEKQDED